MVSFFSLYLFFFWWLKNLLIYLPMKIFQWLENFRNSFEWIFKLPSVWLRVLISMDFSVTANISACLQMRNVTFFCKRYRLNIYSNRVNIYIIATKKTHFDFWIQVTLANGYDLICNIYQLNLLSLIDNGLNMSLSIE